MSTRRAQESKVTLEDGSSYNVTFIENPTIDDVVVSEMKVQAMSIATKQPILDRRVSRELRDFLVRLGVER